MEEDITTSTDQEEQAPADDSAAQPDDTQAVQDESEDNSNEESDTDPTGDDDLAWASKKGIKTDDPKVLLKMVRESEKRMHEATAQAAEANALRNTVQDVSINNDQGETDQLLNRLKVTDFYLNKPEARQLDAEMAAIVTEKPYLAEDLDTVYDLARFRSADAKLDEARKSGYKDALNLQAQAEAAGPPKASATTRSTPKEITDDDIANMSLAEYKAAKESGQITAFAA